MRIQPKHTTKNTMKLNLSNSHDINKFKTYSQTLLDKGAKVELKEVKSKRTLNQNSYLYALFSLWCIEFGYTLHEGKTLLKRECGFMTYEKNGQKFLRSTADLDTKEMTEFIEWFRNYSSSQGLYLLSSEEYITHRFEIDKEIDRFKPYL